MQLHRMLNTVLPKDNVLEMKLGVSATQRMHRKQFAEWKLIGAVQEPKSLDLHACERIHTVSYMCSMNAYNIRKWCLNAVHVDTSNLPKTKGFKA